MGFLYKYSRDLIRLYATSNSNFLTYAFLLGQSENHNQIIIKILLIFAISTQSECLIVTFNAWVEKIKITMFLLNHLKMPFLIL